MPAPIAAPGSPCNGSDEQEQQGKGAEHDRAADVKMGKPVRKTTKSGLPPPQKQGLENAGANGLDTRCLTGAHTATPHKNRMKNF